MARQDVPAELVAESEAAFDVHMIADADGRVGLGREHDLDHADRPPVGHAAQVIRPVEGAQDLGLARLEARLLVALVLDDPIAQPHQVALEGRGLGLDAEQVRERSAESPRGERDVDRPADLEGLDAAERDRGGPREPRRLLAIARTPAGRHLEGRVPGERLEYGILGRRGTGRRLGEDRRAVTDVGERLPRAAGTGQQDLRPGVQPHAGWQCGETGRLRGRVLS